MVSTTSSGWESKGVQHATYSRQGKATETGRDGYSHHLDNHERDVCGKMLIDACNTRAWMLAAMEEVVPVCDRFLSLGRFSNSRTDDCISRDSDPE